MSGPWLDLIRARRLGAGAQNGQAAPNLIITGKLISSLASTIRKSSTSRAFCWKWLRYDQVGFQI